MWMIRRIGIVAVAISLVPLALFALGYTFLWVLGCKADLSGPIQCLVFAVDIGGSIGSIFMLGFILLVLSTPPAVGIAVAWILIELINVVRLRRFP